MRAYVPDFQLAVAKSLADALDRLAEGFIPFAGGTDLMVVFNAGKLRPVPMVSIRKLPELNGISFAVDSVEIGSAVTYSELRQHSGICAEFPLLAQSASWTGGIANQNRGTLGGNIANASPAADSAPVLLVYEAELKLVSKQSERWVPYASFHRGYKTLALEAGELIASMRLRRSKPVHQYGRKVGTRKAMAISKVSFAAILRGDVYRIAAGSVAPVPLRCLNTEAFLAGKPISAALIEQAMEVIKEEIAPISDIRSTSDYRTVVTANLLGEFLEQLL